MSKVNAWKYGREIYLVGRSNKFRYLTAKEREAVIAFISAIIENRKGIAARLNLKYDNAGKELEKQNSYALLKMVQVIGRNFKVQFPTEAEKALCDTLIAAVAPRATMGYNDYQCDGNLDGIVDDETSEEESEDITEETTNEEQTQNTEEQKTETQQKTETTEQTI